MKCSECGKEFTDKTDTKIHYAYLCPDCEEQAILEMIMDLEENYGYENDWRDWY